MTEHADSTSRDRPLVGIGAFVAKLGIGTLIAIIGAVAALRLIGAPKRAVGERSTRAPYTATFTAAPGSVGARRPPEPARDGAAAFGPIARDVERRHAAGELSEAQRRFDPCPGGDVRRVAWIDHQVHVVKIIRYRTGGDVVEEWYDDAGRLREASVRTTAGGHPWRRRVVVDDRGRESVVESTEGVAPDEPPPTIATRNPDEAFFSGAGCIGR